MSKLVHVSERQVAKLVSISDSIRLVRRAYVRLASKKALSPERVLLSVPGRVSVFCMPAHLLGQKTVSVKVARLSPSNPEKQLPAVMATIYVYDSSTGQELARVEAESLTALRTAASSAVATDLLARKTVEVLGLIGTGAQALAHVAALLEVRKFSQIIVYSRNRVRREAFAKNCAKKHGMTVVPASSSQRVVESADVLVLTTNSQIPLFNGEMVLPGTHVNAVGAALPEAREFDSVLAKRSFLVVDSVAQAKSSYGDILIPLKEGAIRDASLEELGELLLRPSSFQRKAEDITLFKSGGLAVLDAIVADHIISILRHEH